MTEAPESAAYERGPAGADRETSTFEAEFADLTGFTPFLWQRRLFEHLMAGGIPSALDLPTGLGKTSVMAIWLIALAHGAELPRRLVYVVDRRAVVDQATDEAGRLRCALDGKCADLKRRLGFDAGQKLAISTLRGAHADNREWLADPALPAIIVGTVDMIGSRLLFRGYGASRRMRPYHAGLLGIDALIVLDEAHLAPPFAQLLGAIEQEQSFQPADPEDRALLPRFVFFPLSATQREPDARRCDRLPFRLKDEDRQSDYGIKKRLDARKTLHIVPLDRQSPDRQLAEAAWALAQTDGKFHRVIVFCARRDKQDEDGGGPSVQGVKEEIEKLAKGDRKSGRAATDIYPPELLVGGRRVWEREGAAQRLRKLGFIGEKDALAKPAFLLATAAGEVGVDVDADHMVSDLVAWERMVQRLGRVNRRGEGAAEVVVFWAEPAIKDANKPTATERRALVAFAAKPVLESLPLVEGAFGASPGALLALAQTARQDEALRLRISAATTPEPLYPALNRPLVDAWSMTSLETHTGRPNVGPWLRGWEDEIPQTTIVWRAHLPFRIDGDGAEKPADARAIESFFEAAPPHLTEKLETETYRVAAWLEKRARTLLSGKPNSPEEALADTAPDAEAIPAIADGAQEPDGGGAAIDGAGDKSAGVTQYGQGTGAGQYMTGELTDSAASEAGTLRPDSLVAVVLNSATEYSGRCYTLGDLAEERKGKARVAFEAELQGTILVLDQRFAGLKDGLLEDGSNGAPVETADALLDWSIVSCFRVRRSTESPEEPSPDEEWPRAYAHTLRRDGNGDPVEWLFVEHFADAPRTGDARSISRPQGLAEHQALARDKVLRIGGALGLPGGVAKALACGAVLHDEGKRASRWQRAFKAPRDARKFGISDLLAKTRGPIDQQILAGYRHEFGSVLRIDANPELIADIPEEWRELILHLIAAHHGRARPLIETGGCEDGPPSALESQAAAIALRFARLQKRWGPWGLAWWEALMRSADQQASRENDAGHGPGAGKELR